MMYFNIDPSLSYDIHAYPYIPGSTSNYLNIVTSNNLIKRWRHQDASQRLQTADTHCVPAVRAQQLSSVDVMRPHNSIRWPTVQYILHDLHAQHCQLVIFNMAYEQASLTE